MEKQPQIQKNDCRIFQERFNFNEKSVVGYLLK